MIEKRNTFGKFQSISRKAAASITGGNNNNEDEVEYVYVMKSTSLK